MLLGGAGSNVLECPAVAVAVAATFDPYLIPAPMVLIARRRACDAHWRLGSAELVRRSRGTGQGRCVCACVCVCVCV